MKKRTVAVGCILVVLIATWSSNQSGGLATPTGPQSSWVSVSNGHLVYKTDAQGNRIPDFSSVGYERGDAAIPDVSTDTTLFNVTLLPQSTGDDTQRIQDAIDSVAQHTTNAQGLRGSVFLSAGQYRLNGTLTIATGGVVLRGAGSDSNGTVLLGQGSPHALVTAQGSGSWEEVGNTHTITDDYVPVGSSSFHVDSAADLTVNEQVIVQRPFTDNWIQTIGMDQIPPRPDGTPSTPWPSGAGLLFDRTITAIQGNQVTVDVPLTNAIEKQYTDGQIWGYSFPGRISQVGIENLRADDSAFTDDSNPGFADIDAVQNGWMQNITLEHFGSGIVLDTTAKWITVKNVQDLDMVTSIASGEPVAFEIVGQQNLVENCLVTGNGVHAWATLSRVPGPNVFTQCTASGDNHLDAGPHERWGTGTLYDNMTISTGRLAIENRTYRGTGQGWAGANSVLWNCNATSYTVENPPTAQNWAIGCIGQQTTSQYPPGIVEFSGQHVQPTSLYTAQLIDRLGTLPTSP